MSRPAPSEAVRNVFVDVLCLEALGVRPELLQFAQLRLADSGQSDA